MFLRRLVSLVAGAVIALTAVITVTAPAHSAPADAAYVMAYFKESLNGDDSVNAVHLAVSTDAREWTPLNDNQAVLTATAGTKGIRDPFIFRRNDGTWVVAATDIPKGGDFWAPNPNIHIWTSPDLVNWSADRLLNVNRPNTGSFTWAPSVYWDGGRQKYGVTFSTTPTGYDHSVIMVSYTSDFVTATAPVVLHDTGGNAIDSHLVTGVNGVNYLYYADYVTGRLAGARSNSLAPGSFVTYTDGVGNGSIEAPTLVKSLTSNTWWLWGDHFNPNNVFYAWQGDIATGVWQPVPQQTYTAPLNSKHNAIHPITADDRTRLLGRYGGTRWNRLKSYNHPDSFVRHANLGGRIDAMPFASYQDAQWRLVPGLADPSAVSLESVNYPGHYLRHQNFEIRLGRDDGSAGFRADATFHRVPGLAHSDWSSFRSFNYPTRYIRHSNRQLLLQEVQDALGRDDATFRIGY